MTEVSLPQPMLTPTRPITGIRLSLCRFVRSQAPSPVDRSGETPVDHDQHFPTTRSSSVLQLKPNKIAQDIGHTTGDIHEGDNEVPDDPNSGLDKLLDYESSTVREQDQHQVGTVNSETPSEKLTAEVTDANTVKNQFSFKVLGDELNKYITHTFQGKKSNKKKTKHTNTLPRPNERQLELLLTHFHKNGLMFPYPGQNTHRKEGFAKRWRFWASKVVTNSSDGLMSDYKSSLAHAREYKSCKSTGWKSFKGNMEFIAQLLSTDSQSTAVTHVLKRGVYPTDIDVFQNSLTLYLPVQRSRIHILTDALTKILGNEDDYIFYDKDFDISRFRSFIIGTTFLKTLAHITIKVWIQPVVTSKNKKTIYFHENNTRMIQNLCQLLYDASQGELGEDISSCMYCDNRMKMDTPYVFPQLYRGRA